MGILQLPTQVPAMVGVLPANKFMVSSDNLATITAAGYLNAVDLQSNPIGAADVLQVLYSYNQQTNSGTYGIFTVSISNGSITLVNWANPGDVLLPVVSGHFANFNGTTGQIHDAGFLPTDASKTRVVMQSAASVIGNFPKYLDITGTLVDSAISPSDSSKTKAVMANGTVVADNIAIFTDTAGTVGQNIAGNNTVSSASATPGTVRAIKGVMSLSNATYANTTNSVAGVRGEIDMVGASSGYVYGVQGKVIPTGTLSGSIWAPAVFGQYDLTNATINAGQIAAIWGDMGANAGTFTDVTGARMFAGTNTIDSLVLNSMIYLYGRCSNLFELSGDSSNYISAGGATASGTIKKIAITIGGVQYYLQAATVYS